MNHVSYRVDIADLPYVRVSVRGMEGRSVEIADGATPWHASARMREIARDLVELADDLDSTFANREP